MTAVTQEWTHDLSMMQQSVLIAAVRGPDTLTKYHPAKYLLRWFRRCVLLSAMDGRVLADPIEPNGGSFTGPSVEQWAGEKWIAVGGERSYGARLTVAEALDDIVTEYLKRLDETPHHYQLHFMHAVEILGYKHPNIEVRIWWHSVYERLVLDMHLRPETEEELDFRLGDSREQWLAVADPATRS